MNPRHETLSTRQRSDSDREAAETWKVLFNAMIRSSPAYSRKKRHGRFREWEVGNRPDSPMKIRPVQEQDGRWPATYSNSPSTIRTPSPYHIPRNFLLVLDFRPTCHHLAMFDGFYASFSIILERVTLLLLSSFQIIDRLFKKFVQI